MVCYRAPYQPKTACGRRSDLADRFLPNDEEIDCSFCLNSEIYKNDLYEFEIGCDGNPAIWEEIKFDPENTNSY